MTKLGLFIGATVASLILAPLDPGAAHAGPASGSTDAAPGGRRAGVAPADLTILQKLHDANQTEVQMGTMAIDKGKSAAVKAFGRKLVADHTAADKKIGDFLKKRGLDMTALASTTSNDSAHDGTADKSGAEYDRAFAAQMVIDHQKAIDLVEGARRDTSDAQLRTFLGQILPTLRDHLATARGLADGKGST